VNPKSPLVEFCGQAMTGSPKILYRNDLHWPKVIFNWASIATKSQFARATRADIPELDEGKICIDL